MENKVLHRSSSQPTACAAFLPGRFAQKTTWHSNSRLRALLLSCYKYS